MIYRSIFIINLLPIVVGAQMDMTNLKGDYLGQKPPGMKAELFAPGIVSTDAYEHSAPAFSPDGNTVLWTIIAGGKPSYLLEMKRVNGSWTKPAKPSFTDTTADDVYASFSPDGNKLYFGSRRKLPAGYSENTGTRIWEVEKKGNGWGKPLPFDTIVSNGNCFAHSVDNDGSVYLSVGGSGGTNWNIYYSNKSGGTYQPSKPLPYNINSFGYEDGPFISPDGSYLIYESDRPEGIDGSIDLYICFRDKIGQWTVPLNMGSKVNSEYTERFARVSADGKYLFFGSDRRKSTTKIGADIYWIDAGIISELREQHKKSSLIESEMGIALLSELENKEFGKAAISTKRWVMAHPEDKSAWIDHCTVLRNNHQYAEAEQISIEKLTAWPGDPNLQAELLLNMLAQNKKTEAETYIVSQVTGDKAKKNIYLKLATQLLESNKNMESAEYFEKVVAIEPSSYDYYRLASAYLADNNPGKAISALEKAASHGYPKEYLAGDPSLQSLRSDTRFMKLIKDEK